MLGLGVEEPPFSVCILASSLAGANTLSLSSRLGSRSIPESLGSVSSLLSTGWSAARNSPNKFLGLPRGFLLSTDTLLRLGVDGNAIGESVAWDFPELSFLEILLFLGVESCVPNGGTIPVSGIIGIGCSNALPLGILSGG